MNEVQARENFLARLNRPWMADEMFDTISDSVFFVKDSEARYVAVNQTLVDRCGRQSKADLIGRTARDLFPASLGDRFTEQDLDVVRTGEPIRGELELHLYPNGREGWCLTWKEPITDNSGKIAGISGISRDLPNRSELTSNLEAVSVVLRHIDEHLDQPLPAGDLAEMAGLSTYQLDQRIRVLFEVSVSQLVTRRRIEHACHLLERSDEPLGFVALDCGYSDQSAFTRQFRQSVGMPPGAYRDAKRNNR